ncbi:MAG: class II fructose-bisphosphate aldolase [Candidatus Liptonbacteria bacterium]|nr:class II fructose-bisphosphate aldolase [Candidatus Liptonbacteria bacterium]
MRTLSDILHDTVSGGVAIGHFNIADITALRAIFDAARETSKLRNVTVPVMIGVSEGERDFIGLEQAVALVKSLRDECDYPVFINADHTHSLDKVKEAALAGYDEILFDPTPNFVGRGASGSQSSLEESIKLTRQAVEIVKSINPNILVEGEIGYIGSSSEVMEKRPEGIELTTPEEAAQFVKETGVDVLAPAVGNMHGLLRQMVEGKEHKKLDIERIRAIKESVRIPLTLHGGSGTADEDFVAAIKAGINIIHINTEIRIAWRRGVEEGLAKNPDEVAPYKILPPAYEAIKKIALARLKLFNNR